ncbi:MAG: hypothetical protein JWO96_576 [Candidatus Saccharibacteria bacterium]|nr:hypothetical protein [Candidatus Saccharibacteria bacterium]
MQDYEDINELLAPYVEGATQFVANPSTLNKMIDMGLKLDKPVHESTEDYISRTFDERKEVAKAIVDELPKKPNLALPPILSLYDEISECVLFGLNGAAISLSAVLVEFSIKHAIVDRNSGVEIYDKAEWNRVEKKELGAIIAEAEKLKLFNEDGIKQLVQFKNNVRNPYLHYNIKEITKDVIMKEAFAYNAETNKVEKKYNLKAEDNPFLWELGKRKVDEETVLIAFRFADSVVRALFLKPPTQTTV